MKIIYSATHTLVQSGLTAMLLIVWQIWVVQDIFVAFQSQVILTFFIGLFGVGFGILFIRMSTIPRMLATSVATAIMVTLVFTIYPQFGYNFAWYILFGILLLAGVLAHMLLYGSGARYGEKTYDTT